VFQATGDVPAPGQPEQADGDVPGGGKELRRCSGTYLGTIFIKSAVTHVMLAVFRFPVAAVAGQEVGRIGLPGGQASLVDSRV